MEGYKFFQNRACEYFPCHKVKDDREFNCMFCYCPLYLLGEECGGDFAYTEKGVKNCMGCTKPHGLDGYEHVQEHIQKVIQKGKKC